MVETWVLRRTRRNACWESLESGAGSCLLRQYEWRLCICGCPSAYIDTGKRGPITGRAVSFGQARRWRRSSVTSAFLARLRMRGCTAVWRREMFGCIQTHRTWTYHRGTSAIVFHTFVSRDGTYQSIGISAWVLCKVVLVCVCPKLQAAVREPVTSDTRGRAYSLSSRLQAFIPYTLYFAARAFPKVPQPMILDRLPI